MRPILLRTFNSVQFNPLNRNICGPTLVDVMAGIAMTIAVARINAMNGEIVFCDGYSQLPKKWGFAPRAKT
jgi:hypothetical protein